MVTKVNTLIIGSGISGLSSAHLLYQKGKDFCIIEKSDRIGGVLNTQKKDGFQIELSAATVKLTPQLKKLISDLNIENETIYSNVKSKRYVLKFGKLNEISPKKILTTPLLSFIGKLRILKEFFIPVYKGKKDETVAEFITRRFGKEVLDNLVDPFISGIYAGNPKKMSLKSCFPTLYKMEQKNISIIKAFLKKNKTEPLQYISFKKGISFLTDSIANQFLDRIHLNTKITNIEKKDNLYYISVIFKSKTVQFIAKKIICTIPAHSFNHLFDHINPNIQKIADKIYYPPMVVLNLGYEKTTHKNNKAFGFLIPSKEKKSFLGAIFNTNVFKKNINTPNELYTLFIGGDRVFINENNIENNIKTAQSEFENIMNFNQKPIFKNYFFYKKSIPQYYVNHDEIVTEFRKIEQKNPGLEFRGNYLTGISLSDCIFLKK